MIRVKADPSNKSVYFQIDKMTKEHRKAIRNAAYDIGREIQRRVRRNILSRDKTGKKYRVGLNVHQASAPYEAPANLTGKLARSVDYDVRMSNQVEFGYKKLYGKFLEDGTINMKPRPNLRPVATGKSQQFINLMVKHYANK